MLLVAHLWYSWHLFTLKQQIKDFEQKFGLTSTAASRLKVSVVPINQPAQWRIYGEAPVDRFYCIRAQIDGLDQWPAKTNTSAPIFRQAMFGPGSDVNVPDFFIDMRMTSDELRYDCAWVTGSIKIPADHPLRQRALSEFVIELLPNSANSTIGSEVPLPLLRIRDPDNPRSGLVVWIDDRKPNAEGF